MEILEFLKKRKPTTGFGDELIASGQARRLNEATGRKVIIRDRAGRIRSHPIWANNPRIVGPSERPFKPEEIVNGPGVRPYIASKSEARWTWNTWECPVGEIYFSEDELAFAARHSPQIVIEPNVKQKASPNKDWGRGRWIELVALLRASGLEPVQLGPAGTQILPGVEITETPSFRHACAVLARAHAAILPEGGLHHAAAALKVPSVVIFGGYISPAQTGYASQVNLFTGGAPCGMRTPCAHCAEAMAKIAPETVFEQLMDLFKNSRGANQKDQPCEGAPNGVVVLSQGV